MDRSFRAGAGLVIGLSILGCREGPTRPSECDADPQTVTLAELRGTTVRASGNGGCVAAEITAAEGRYLVVPQYAGEADDPTATDFLIGPGGVSAAVTASSLTVSRALQREQLPPQVILDNRLRQLEAELALSPGARDLVPRRAPGEAAVVVAAAQFPETRTFRVLGNLDGTTFVTATARLKYLGDNLAIYQDVEAPLGFSDSALAEFGKLFDDVLYPLGVATFGSVSDIDESGKIIVLMSQRINALVSKNECQNGIITGYFYGFDLSSTSTNSNRGEVFYALVPDPQGAHSCSVSVASVQRIVPATFIHELQHMISYNQHVLTRSGAQERVWLNEGLSLIAEEMGSKYYENKYPAPLGRGDPDQLFPDSSQGFIVPNMTYAYDYLSAPEQHSVTTFDDFGTLAERGAAWLFLRWLGDQKGESIYRALVQTNLTSIENVERQAGEPFRQLFGDFSIAAYADNLPGVDSALIPARYQFTSRNLRSIYARFHELGTVARPYPIVPRLLNCSSDLEGSMSQGTMSYFLTPAACGGAGVHFVREDGRQFSSALEAQTAIFRLPAP